MSDTISKVQKFLEEWIEKDEVPNNILEIDFKNLSNKKIVRELGLYLQKEYKDVKTPRVYQFIKYALNPVNDIDKNLDLLLQIVSREDRDVIEEVLDRELYRAELFSSIGLTRLKNQDYLGYLELENGILLIVADGVGGGDSGEIASKLVVDSVIKSFKESFKQNNSKEQIKGFFKEKILKANRELLEFANKYQKSTMATTLSMTLVLNNRDLYIAHVGDSRVYELKEDFKVKQRTPDHSVREILYNSKKITEEEKENYQKNILAYAIGKNNLKPNNIFIEYSTLQKDSKLLLCSDGFWEKIDINGDIFNIPFNALKEQIYSKIPTDNVTVIRYFPKTDRNRADLKSDNKKNLINKNVKTNKILSNRKTKSEVLTSKKQAITITIITIFILIIIIINNL